MRRLLWLVVATLSAPGAALAWDMVRVPKTGAPGDPGGIDWPSPRFTKGEYSPVITDELTGLMWLTDARLIGPTDDLPALYEQVEALNSSEDGWGFFDWRVPNIRELLSLQDWGRGCDTLTWLEQQGFEHVRSSYFHSSTDPMWQALASWRFDCGEADPNWPMAFGWAVRNHKPSAKGYPAKTGQTGFRYEHDDGWNQHGVQWKRDARWRVLECGVEDDPSDDVIIDTLTGYLWARDVEAVTYDEDTEGFDTLKGRAEGLDLCGLSRWRLPDLNELTLLLDNGVKDQRQHLIDRGFVNVPEPTALGAYMLVPSTTPDRFEAGVDFVVGYGFDQAMTDWRVVAVAAPAENEPRRDEVWGLAMNPTHGELKADPPAGFGALDVGRISASKTITLTNEGIVPLQVFSLEIEGDGAAHFVIARTDCRRAVLWDHDYDDLAGEPYVDSCEVTLVFAPLAAGSHTARLVVTSTDPEDFELTLSGSGVDGDVDGDGVADWQDRCVEVADAGQGDADEDGVGDVCDPCPEDPDNGCLWAVEIADEHGRDASLTIDRAGTLHAAHQGQTSEAWVVRYSRSPAPGRWENETAFRSITRDEPLGYETAIGVDAMGRPQIIFVDAAAELVRGVERYAFDGSWGASVLGHTEPWDADLYGSSLTTTPSGAVFAAWVKDPGVVYQDLWLSAKPSGGAWSSGVLATAEEPTGVVCVTHNGRGAPVIAYGSAKNELRLLADGVDELVDVSPPSACAVLVDAAGTIHLAYFGAVGEVPWLVYARKPRLGGWIRERLEELWYWTSSLSLALTPDGRALFTWANKASSWLIEHRERGPRGGWLRSRVPAELFLVGQGPRAPSVLDAGGALHVVFGARGATAGSGALVHATRPVVRPDGADLDVELVAEPDPSLVGGGLLHEIHLVNLGPEVARDVVLVFEAEGAVMAYQGEGCALESGALVCRVAELAAKGERVITVLTAPDGAGPHGAVVEVSAASVDPVLANNRAELEPMVVDTTVGPWAGPLDRGPNAASVVAVTPDTKGAGLMAFGLWAGEREAVELEALEVAVAGTGDDREITRLAVVLDVDGDGAAGADEPVIATRDRPFATDDGAALLELAEALRVEAGARVGLIVVADLGVRAADMNVALLAALTLALLLSLWLRRARFVVALAALLSCGGDGGGRDTIGDDVDTNEVTDTDIQDSAETVDPDSGTTYRLHLVGLRVRSGTFGSPVPVAGLPVAGALAVRSGEP